MRLIFWNRAFITKSFREKDVLFSRFNRRLTLRHTVVNPVKLRSKRKTLKGLAMYDTQRIKNYYYNFRESQFRKVVRKAVYAPANIRSNRYTADHLAPLLEMRLDAVLFKTGLFTTPHLLRHLFAHRKILVDQTVVTKPSVYVKPGQIITFADVELRNLLVKRFLFMLDRFRRLRGRRLKSKPFLPIFAINRVVSLYLDYRTFRLMVVRRVQYQKEVYYPFPLDYNRMLFNYTFA